MLKSSEQLRQVPSFQPPSFPSFAQNGDLLHRPQHPLMVRDSSKETFSKCSPGICTSAGSKVAVCPSLQNSNKSCNTVQWPFLRINLSVRPRVVVLHLQAQPIYLHDMPRACTNSPIESRAALTISDTGAAHPAQNQRKCCPIRKTPILILAERRFPMVSSGPHPYRSNRYQASRKIFANG